jgi:diacylglycerol kinase family enzyme
MDLSAQLRGMSELMLDIAFGEQPYEITIDGKKEQGDAFMLAFANGSEFGNRFIIDPQGDARDGKFSLVIVRKPPYMKLVSLLISGFKGKLKESKYYRKIQLNKLEITSPGATLHRDGEVDNAETAERLYLELLPASLKVIF